MLTIVEKTDMPRPNLEFNLPLGSKLIHYEITLFKATFYFECDNSCYDIRKHVYAIGIPNECDLDDAWKLIKPNFKSNFLVYEARIS